jgi:hypothetical protein
MKSPEEAKKWARQRLVSQRRKWFDGLGSWPQSLSLDRPTRAVAQRDRTAVRAWSAKWREWIELRKADDPVVQFEDVTWADGQQTFAARLTFADPSTLAKFVGESTAWELALYRRSRMIEAWPQLEAQRLGRFLPELVAEEPADFERLMRLLTWLTANPDSGLYVRQLPVEDVDTKWVHGRRSLVSQIFQRISQPVALSEPEQGIDSDEESETASGVITFTKTDGAKEADEATQGMAAAPGQAESETEDEEAESSPTAGDFYRICGLRRAAPLVKVAVLCPYLRAAVGGLRDFESPLGEIAKLPIQPTGLIIIENLETAYSLEDARGVVAIVKLGNAVTLLAEVPWAHQCPVLYWGDIDTYGFSILAVARRTLEPRGATVTSMLMDRATLESHKHLMVQESQQTPRVDRSLLRDHEAEVYAGLLDKVWGPRVRIEQERLPWTYVSAALKAWHSVLIERREA